MEINTLEYWNDYDVEALQDAPSKNAAVFTFKQRREPAIEPGQISLEVPLHLSDWLTLKVRKGDNSWVGRFEPGVDGLTGVYATPCESVLCVVVCGQGYWIPVDSPEDYKVIPSVPIKKVIAVPKAEIMIFVDFVRLTAYNRSGLAWQTPSLSWDGLKINKVTQDLIEGQGWDAPNNCDVKFAVKVSDGEYTGGSSPELSSVASK